MTGKPRIQIFHRIELISLDINQMNIDNHRIICGKRDKNQSQPINTPFTRLRNTILETVFSIMCDSPFTGVCKQGHVMWDKKGGLLRTRRLSGDLFTFTVDFEVAGYVFTKRTPLHCKRHILWSLAHCLWYQCNIHYLQRA